jgi:hypothetical protein
LSSEIWLEVADQGIGMVDSEVGTVRHISISAPISIVNH